MNKNECLKITKPRIATIDKNVRTDSNILSIEKNIVERKITEKLISIGIKDILIVDGQNARVVRS